MGLLCSYGIFLSDRMDMYCCISMQFGCYPQVYFPPTMYCYLGSVSLLVSMKKLRKLHNGLSQASPCFPGIPLVRTNKHVAKPRVSSVRMCLYNAVYCTVCVYVRACRYGEHICRYVYTYICIYIYIQRKVYIERERDAMRHVYMNNVLSNLIHSV